MATGDGKEGSAGKRGDAAELPDADSLEISSRGKVVIRSSSHPPGTRPPTSDAPAEPGQPAGRAKRNTPARRPRGRRAVRGMTLDGSDRDSESATPSSIPPPAYEEASARSARALWIVLAVGLVAAVLLSYFTAR